MASNLNKLPLSLWSCHRIAFVHCSTARQRFLVTSIKDWSRSALKNGTLTNQIANQSKLLFLRDQQPTNFVNSHHPWSRGGPIKALSCYSSQTYTFPQRSSSETLDAYTEDLVGYLRQLGVQQQQSDTYCPLIADIGNLLYQADSQDGVPLNDMLRYEPNPSLSRRVQISNTSGADPQEASITDRHETTQMSPNSQHLDVIDEDRKVPQMPGGTNLTLEVAPIDQLDGNGLISLFYIIVDGLTEQVTTCSGFVISTQDTPEPLIVTCAHTLWQTASTLKTGGNNPNSENSLSGCLARSSSGKLYAVTQVAASLAAADILILRIKDLGRLRCLEHAVVPTRMRSLPLSPYPPAEQSLVWLPQLRDSARHARLPVVCWEAGEVIEYKDVMGISAQPGTYDELLTFTLTTVPVAGASGGPVVNEDGAVVGIVRGHQSGYGERQSRGFATVAEKIWELFRLPGFQLKSSSSTKDS